MEDEISKLRTEIEQIKFRNKNVETDKAWETSLFRRFLLIIFTYLSVGLYLNAINVDRPWINAIVPAIGFLLSTLTLTFFKKLWLKFYKNRVDRT